MGLLQGNERECDVPEEIWIRVLPYLDDLFFPKRGVRACRLMGIRIERDCFKASLQINFHKSGLLPMGERKYLGFDVDLGAGYLRVPTDR